MPCARFVAAPPQAFHLKRSQPEFSFNPLLEILSAVGQEVSSSQQQAPKRRKSVITPRFDIRETEDAFYVEGELPGVADKEAIEIQFTDVQTLMVKGEITRRSHPVSQSEVEEPQAAVERPKSPTPSTQSLKPTVEDQVDESISGDETSNAASSVMISQGEKSVVSVEVPETTKEKKSQPKYWLRERSVGAFERNFEFQSLIDPEGVKASLEDGILEIRIPKRQPYVKKVQIQ